MYQISQTKLRRPDYGTVSLGVGGVLCSNSPNSSVGQQALECQASGLTGAVAKMNHTFFHARKGRGQAREQDEVLVQPLPELVSKDLSLHIGRLSVSPRYRMVPSMFVPVPVQSSTVSASTIAFFLPRPSPGPHGDRGATVKRSEAKAEAPCDV